MINEELSREQILRAYGNKSPDAVTGATRRSPFKFLDSYEAADADIFFGRDYEIAELLGHFHSYGHVLIYGESGSGKTSLVQCGLRSRIPSADALLIPLRVHAAGLSSVGHQIRESAALALGEPVEDLSQSNLVETLREVCQAASRPLVLFFDQFEELFIFHDAHTRRQFADDLASLRQARLNVKVIIGVRQDYLAHLSELEDTVEGLFDNRFWLRRMSRENAARAVVQACHTCDVGIDDDVARSILHRLDPSGLGIELPYLQVVMDRLYRQAVSTDSAQPVMTAQDVQELGDIDNILGSFLVEEVGKLPSPDAGRQILKAFVTREGTRRTLDRESVVQEAAGFGAVLAPAELDAHLSQLARVRVLREIAETKSYELRHDALAATVAGWISEVEKELIDVRDNLVNRFKEYEARGGQQAALLDQGFLDYLSVYQQRLRPLLNDTLRQYVEDSQRHVQAAQRFRRRVRQLITGVVGSIILVCLVLAMWQWNTQQRANDANRFATALDRFLTEDLAVALENAARSGGTDFFGGALSEASSKFAKALPDNPNLHLRMHVSFGNLLLQTGELDAAERQFKAAQELLSTASVPAETAWQAINGAAIVRWRRGDPGAMEIVGQLHTQISKQGDQKLLRWFDTQLASAIKNSSRSLDIESRLEAIDRATELYKRHLPADDEPPNSVSLNVAEMSVERGVALRGAVSSAEDAAAADELQQSSKVSMQEARDQLSELSKRVELVGSHEPTLQCEIWAEYAKILHRLRQYPEADDAYFRACTLLRDVLGTKHWRTTETVYSWMVLLNKNLPQSAVPDLKSRQRRGTQFYVVDFLRSNEDKETKIEQNAIRALAQMDSTNPDLAQQIRDWIELDEPIRTALSQMRDVSND